MTPEEEFEAELETFRIQVESGIQFLYLNVSIQKTISQRKSCLNYVNESPLLWKTVIGALQTAWFITLGRIFDQKSPHNVDRLLNVASRHLAIFSKPALAVRKRKGSANADEWIGDYMKRVNVPTISDFRRLRKMVALRRRAYEQRYRSIRHQVYAHTIETDPERIGTLYKGTTYSEVEKMLTFLKKLYLALWELYNNGAKLRLRPMRHSAAHMLRSPRPKWRGYTVQEDIVQETVKLFEKACPTRRCSRRSGLSRSVRGTARAIPSRS